MGDHVLPAFDLVRALPTVIFRADAHPADGDGSLGTLIVQFSRFNTWYEVESLWEGHFLERTRPGAFAQTIADDRDQMRILFDHGFDPQIGGKVLAPITDLREDPKGPVGEGPLLDTSYNRDLLPGLRAGVYGSSFRFRVQQESWDDEPKPSERNPKGIPERTILRAKVMEFGPVTFPANPAATAELNSAGASLTDQFYERLRQRDESAFAAAVRAARVLHPDFTGRPDTRRAGGGDPTPTTAGASQASPDQFDPHARDRAWHLRRRLTHA